MHLHRGGRLIAGPSRPSPNDDPLELEGVAARPGPADADADADAADAASAQGGRRNPAALARERLAKVIDAGLQRAFDVPFEVRGTPAAMALLRDPPPAWVAPALLRGVEWALGRGVGGRMATRYGLRVGGTVGRKVILPVTVALEASISARDGIRELQVMASYLDTRLRDEGLPGDHELIRRTVSSLYLDPLARPDLHKPAYQLALGIARRWLTFSLPVPGVRWRRRRAAEARLDAVGRLDLHELVRHWHGRPRRSAPTVAAPLPPPPPLPPSSPLPG